LLSLSQAVRGLLDIRDAQGQGKVHLGADGCRNSAEGGRADGQSGELTPSAGGSEAFLADLQSLGDRAFPPVGGREDLDLDEARIAGCLNIPADGGNIDDAVAHHAAVVEDVPCRKQPVADMKYEDAIRTAGACDLSFEVRVPPYVID